jgi:glucose/arabinose dehydrogenase
MGNEGPPDELNHAPKKRMNFGLPFCYGASIKNPIYNKGRNCKEFAQPTFELSPHVAALEMRFYTGTMFSAQYKNRIFISKHGSWDRIMPIGYRIMMVTLNGNKSLRSFPMTKQMPFTESPTKSRSDPRVYPDASIQSLQSFVYLFL